MLPSLWIQSRCSSLRPHVAYCRPEAKRPVTHGDDQSAHASALQIAEHDLPAIRTLAGVVLNRDQLHRPSGRMPIITSVQMRSSSSRKLKWTPSTQT
jgi:hypothetical protein